MDKQPSPAVSVVMPTYNRADLLPEAIASILNQDYRNIELLVVDDGSTDNTGQVIAAIREFDERLHYHKLSENRGIGYARQAGLEQVHGKYVALADSDDIWLEGKLRLQVETLEKYPEIDILFADFWNIDHLTQTESSGFEQTRLGMQHLSARRLQEDLWFVERGVEMGILVDDFVAAPTLLIRRAIFEKVGGFNPDLMAVDHEFNFRAAALGARYAYHDRPLIKRHVYPSSNSQQRIKANNEVLQALSVCLQVCDSGQRTDLVEHVETAFHRTYLFLMYEYGRSGERRQAWYSYWKTGPYRYSIRTHILLLISIGGFRAISLFEYLRRVKHKWLTGKENR